MKEFNPLEKKPINQDPFKKLKRKLGAIVLSGATIFNSGDEGNAAKKLNNTTITEQRKLTREQETENILNKIASSDETDTVFDNNPEFFKILTKNGDFTPEERKERTEQLENGATIFRDIGLLFYKVSRGDTLYSIRNSLSRVPEFSYLKNQPGKIESFNIPPLELVKDMWIPIPLENKDRYLTDEQFTRYAARSIAELMSHERYGKFIKEILKRATVKELLATLVAIAKQEAGGQPIGRYELHRWEPRHNVFSFSLFHVLMNGPGLEARRNLNKSEGQLYHPQNASDLFIAFMKEKDANSHELFPINRQAKNFARFYNGKGWRRTNPNYVRNILRFYNDAKEMIDTLVTEDSPSTPRLIASKEEKIPSAPTIVKPPIPTKPESPKAAPKPSTAETKSIL